MKKNYEPSSTETEIYENWEKSDFFKAQPDESKESFCIMIPPPNVLEHFIWVMGFKIL